MAGHSQFKNIMFRKGAQDKKRAKVFSRISREITIAVKTGGGPDPSANPRLRLAIQNGRAENMPKENIERAIKKAAGNEADNMDEMRYEGYGPGGVAIIVETLTDNKNRSAAAVRSYFAKNGGAMAETGAVSFMFDHVCEIVYPLSAGSADEVLEAAIEAGADDVVSDNERHVIYCDFEATSDVTTALTTALGDPTSANIIWKPQNLTAINADKGETLLKLIATLEDDEDVQNVFANFDIPDDVMAKLTAA